MPRYNWMLSEDDGLEKYYEVVTAQGKQYLLSNNMTYKDREEFFRVYRAHKRACGFSCFTGMWIGTEVVLKHPFFKRMALGWRFASLIGIGLSVREVLNWHHSMYHMPIMGAYLRKYQEKITPDVWTMTDRKREFYEIDTS